MPLEIIGHAIVSADGMIADATHRMPAGLRNDADWRRFQAALDSARLVVVGRLGHAAHPNPGRRRLVVTSSVAAFDDADPRAILWNPAGMRLDAVLDRLAITNGIVAVTGGTRVFDLFLPWFTRFDLVHVAAITIPDGIPCFSSGPPRAVLADAGLALTHEDQLDPDARLEVWSR